eukprot:3447696-Amphidinium_carterae.1
MQVLLVIADVTHDSQMESPLAVKEKQLDQKGQSTKSSKAGIISCATPNMYGHVHHYSFTSVDLVVFCPFWGKTSSEQVEFELHNAQ